MFHDGTSALTIAFLGRAGGSGSGQQTFDPGSQSGSTSVQALAGDLTLAAGYGSSTATSPVYAAGVMGNVISTANMTATQNIIAGVVGKYDLTGTNASVLPKAGVIGEVGDNADTADAALMAVLGGDSAATNPGAAFGVAFLNSTPASNFSFGLDLYRAAIGSYRAVNYGTAAIRVPNAAWMVGRNAADSANVNMLRLDTNDDVAFGADLVPSTSDGAALGTSSLMFSDLFLASGGVINFNNGDVLLTHSSNNLALTGGTFRIGTASSETGQLVLAHASSASTTTFQAGNATEANTYVWPTDGGTSGQVLQTDGATPTTTLSWTTVASGLSFAASDTTERTTTSTSSVDLSTVTVSIPVGTPFMWMAKVRKTSGAANSASFGIKLNATQVLANVAWASGTNQAEFGILAGFIGAHDATYVGTGMAYRGNRTSSGSTWYALDGDMPNATITSFIITAQVGDAAITMAVDDVMVWTFATS